MFKEIPDSKRLFDKMLEQIKKNKESKEDIKTTNNPPRKKYKIKNQNDKDNLTEKKRLKNFIPKKKTYCWKKFK